jgi:hypothetical protein
LPAKIVSAQEMIAQEKTIAQSIDPASSLKEITAIKEPKNTGNKPTLRSDAKKKRRDRIETIDTETIEKAKGNSRRVAKNGGSGDTKGKSLTAETTDSSSLFSPQAGKLTKNKIPETGNNSPSRNSLIEKLKVQYKTSDFMTIFSGEVESGNFQNALVVGDLLDKDYANSKKVKIYKLRALKGGQDRAAFEKMMLSQDLYDGEFYLEKGCLYLDRLDLPHAQEFLKKASVSPCGFLDSKYFRQNLLYSIAQCATAVFDQNGTEEKKKKAMEAWYDVKSLLRTSPEHIYFKNADSAIRRISKGGK